MKKIAVVASGWHYPIQFYEAMARQKMPKDWQISLFCASHRDPKSAKKDKKQHRHADTLRGNLDAILYRQLASKKDIDAMGWQYKEYPNTIGDWGNSNQWLEENNYKDYDLFLFTHDDNLIVHDRLFADIVEDPDFEDWDVLTNSPGMPPGSLRGSFEFFKPRVLDALGGKFDLSDVTLIRKGVTESSEDLFELYDWNNTVPALMRLIEQENFKIHSLSPCYRVSAYCIEGERGYIANTHGINTAYEEEGLRFLHDNGVI